MDGARTSTPTQSVPCSESTSISTSVRFNSARIDETNVPRPHSPSLYPLSTRHRRMLDLIIHHPYYPKLSPLPGACGRRYVIYIPISYALVPFPPCPGSHRCHQLICEGFCRGGGLDNTFNIFLNVPCVRRTTRK